MGRLSDQSGLLYEIPLVLAGFAILCAILPPTQYHEKDRVWSPPAMMALGMGLTLLIFRCISMERFKIFGLPVCVLIFLAVSALTVPFLLRIQDRRIAALVLAFQPYLSLRLDLWLSSRWAERQGR